MTERKTSKKEILPTTDMNQQQIQLLSAIGQNLNISVEEAYVVLSAVIISIHDQILNGEVVELEPLGSFYLKTRKGHVGRNPHDGTPYKINPHYVLKFALSKAMKKEIKAYNVSVLTTPFSEIVDESGN